MSLACSCFALFARSPFTSTFPLSIASAASARVLQQRAAMIGAGARLVLVFALFGALIIWPYAKQCGTGWFGYIGTEAVIVAGGLWVAFTTWRYRLPKMHALSLSIILVGLVLIAAE